MKTIQLALHQYKLPLKYWEQVLPDALHSIRSLISTATGVTPHERMFSFQRRSSAGIAVPTWLAEPGPVLLKRQVKNSKYEPEVDEVHLIEANPQYAHVRFPSGRETTVSLKHLAPIGVETSPRVVQRQLVSESTTNNNVNVNLEHSLEIPSTAVTESPPPNNQAILPAETSGPSSSSDSSAKAQSPTSDQDSRRYPQRERKQPARLIDEIR